MTTERQRQANQENSKKSTGPTTPEGKKKVSQNATKYGLHSRGPIIGGKIFNERQEKYEEFRDAVLASHATGNPLTDALLLQLIDDAWRQARFTAAEEWANENERDKVRKQWASSQQFDREQAEKALSKLDVSSAAYKLEQQRKTIAIQHYANPSDPRALNEADLRQKERDDEESLMAQARATLWKSPDGVTLVIDLLDDLRATVVEQDDEFFAVANHFINVYPDDMDHVYKAISQYAAARNKEGKEDEWEGARLALVTTLDVERQRLLKLRQQMEVELDRQLQEKLATPIAPFGEQYEPIYEADQRIMARMNKLMALMERWSKLQPPAPSAASVSGHAARTQADRK